MTDRPFPLQQQWIGMDLRRRRPDLGRPWRNLSFALLPIALLAVAFGLASRTSSKPAVVVPVQRSDGEPAKRGDKLHTEHAPLTVVTVRTIPVVPSQPQLPSLDPPLRAAAAEADPDVWPVLTTAVKAPPRARDSGDALCRRHKLRKVVTNGGKSWRCRK